MKHWKRIFAIGTFAALIVASCVPTPTPTSPPNPASTPFPTSTPITPTVTPVPTETPTPTFTPIVTEITIRFPREGDRVEHITTVEGTSTNLPDGSVIWVVVFIPVVNRFFPMNDSAVVLVNGDWTAQAVIGQPEEVSLEAVIYVILADSEAQAAFQSYLTEAISKNDFPGMQKIPESAMIYARVSVTRK